MLLILYSHVAITDVFKDFISFNLQARQTEDVLRRSSVSHSSPGDPLGNSLARLLQCLHSQSAAAFRSSRSSGLEICCPLLHRTCVHIRHSSITLGPCADDVIRSSGLSTGHRVSTSSPLMRSSPHQFVPASAPSPDGSPLPLPVQSACGAMVSGVSARRLTRRHERWGWRWRCDSQKAGKEGDEGKCDSLLGDVKLDWICCSSELVDVIILCV